ncbi:type IV secretory system conjugative DNA transfer family protein [Brachybacterium subflavum]|uniref:type IV secretory system conjugative DNA transfer family protein n=1 Tax=Brachybacterium subflavum TaxID=2585206 RepID=UPI00187A2C43|nr:type IV secretory system conjugative DNA transfer family protein [Brachybacterium subflavum]
MINSSSGRRGQSTIPEEPRPYVGFAMDATGQTSGLAEGGVHTLVLAGSGVGKSRRVLVPSICLWEESVVAVSAKSDLAEMSARIRASRGGPMYVMDLTGQADWAQLPEDVIRLSSDPCALLTWDEDGSNDDSALGLAELLTTLGSLGMGGGGGGGGDSAFWMQLAVGTLACLVQAGGYYPDPETGETVWGGGIEWVMQAALDTGEDEDEEEAKTDYVTPSWATAARRAELLGSEHVREIVRSTVLDPRQRDSIGINLRVALSNWKKRTVRGKAGDVPFSPDLLEQPGSTLYLVSPGDGGGASAAASVIESLVRHWTQHSITKGLPKIQMVIDECPQICPLPRLDQYIGVMRSYGMHFLVAAQHSSQFEKRFGEKDAKVLLNIFPSILVGVGAIEKDLIDQAAWTVPPTERKVSSIGSGGQENFSADKTTSMTGAELLPRSMGEARLIVRGLPGTLVKLVDYEHMLTRAAA